MSTIGFFRMGRVAPMGLVAQITITSPFYRQSMRLVEYTVLAWDSTTIPLDTTGNPTTVGGVPFVSKDEESRWGFWVPMTHSGSVDALEDWCVNHFLSQVLGGAHTPLETVRKQYPLTMTPHRILRHYPARDTILDLNVDGMIHRVVYQRNATNELSVSTSELSYRAHVAEASQRQSDGTVVSLSIPEPEGPFTVPDVGFDVGERLTRIASDDYLQRLTIPNGV